MREEKFNMMEDHQGDLKSIKVIKFNNRNEDWTAYVLKFKAIADERGHDEVLKGIVNVPGDNDVTGGEDGA